MKNNITKFISLSLLLSLLLGGCSVKSDSTTSKKNSIEEIYKIVALSTSTYGKQGKPCSDAVGVIKIHNNTIIGKANDSIGRRYNILGESLGGRISGGFTLTKILAVKFIGRINTKTGTANGTWKDLSQCSGTWTAKRVIKRKAHKQSKSIKT